MRQLPAESVDPSIPVNSKACVWLESSNVDAPKIPVFAIMVSMNFLVLAYMSLVIRKPAFCICENKDEDQLHGDREADQRLCFRYTDSTIPLLPKCIISSL